MGPKFFPHVSFKNENIHLVYVDYIESSIKYVKGFFTNSTYISEVGGKDVKNLHFDILGRKNRNSIFKRRGSRNKHAVAFGETAPNTHQACGSGSTAPRAPSWR